MPADSSPVLSRRWLTASRIWHGVIAVVIAACFVTTFVLNVTGSEDPNTGLPIPPQPPSSWLVTMFSYFTIQSNLIMLIAAITLALDPVRDGRWWRVLRLAGLLGIVITGLVFDTILAPKVHLTGISYVVTVGFHYFAPWVSLAGWLLFGPRPRIDLRTVGFAFIWPLAWVGYTFIRGAITGSYPYGFLNAAVLGPAIAVRNTALVLVIALVMAGGLWLLDRIPVLGRRPERVLTGTRRSSS